MYTCVCVSAIKVASWIDRMTNRGRKREKKENEKNKSMQERGVYVLVRVNGIEIDS